MDLSRTPPPPAPRPAGLRALVVEDNPGDVLLLQKYLREAGYEVDCRVVCEREEYRDALETGPWDVVFSDLHLPNFSGAEALELHRRAGHDSPFVVVSGMVGEAAAAVLRAGARDFVRKENLQRLGEVVRRELASAAERRRRQELERQVQIAQKLEAVGRLAGGVAHDFNNLLTVITGYAELARTQLADGHPARPMIREIELAGRRGEALTRQLLAFTRHGPLEHEAVGVAEAVRGFAGMASRLLGPAIALHLELADGLPAVEAAAGQFEQVLLNLVVNARDAMPAGGRLTIRAGRDPDSGGLLLAVRDTGHGMSEAVKRRAFEPLFTTKPVGQGTGLGLANVGQIVAEAGGRVEIDSAPGRGAEFRIYWPASGRAPATPDSASVTRLESAPVAAAVLVCEDDEAIRALIRACLEGAGCRVAAFGTAAEATAHAGGAFDLLITDLLLPDAGGADVARPFLAGGPARRVLYISGIPGDDLELSGREGFLAKPFLPSDLRAAVWGLLQNAGEANRTAPPASGAMDRPADTITVSASSPGGRRG